MERRSAFQILDGGGEVGRRIRRAELLFGVLEIGLTTTRRRALLNQVMSGDVAVLITSAESARFVQLESEFLNDEDELLLNQIETHADDGHAN